jgi:DNA-binding transcriptional regulator PaaX
MRESLTDYIIAMLLSGKSSKTFHMIIHEREFAKYKKGSVRVALSRLNKKRYITNSKEGWKITLKGKTYRNKIWLYSYLSSPFNKNTPSNTIISFDIPGPQRATRDWLRNQLKIFNYKMLQQSLWLGPGPLPDEFLKRLNELKIRDNIKIFKVKK